MRSHSSRNSSHRLLLLLLLLLAAMWLQSLTRVRFSCKVLC
jgi:hypothetical protein